MKRTLLAIACLTVFSFSALPAATINIDSPTVTETDGTTTVTFNITCDPCTEVNAIIGYGTVDGTATTGDGDYVGLTGTIDDLGNGTAIETYPVVVTVNGDLDIEGDETFTLRINTASVGCPSLGGGPGGCEGTAAIGTEGTATILNDDVVDASPTAEANGPYTGSEGIAIPVAATGSSDDNGITTYEWDCANDGTFEISSASATGSSCTYSDQGSFTVRLKVTDTIGQTAEDTAAVTVANVAPAVVVDAGDQQVNEGATANNSGSFSDVAADPLTITADFGTLVDGGDGTWTWSFASTDDIALQAVNVTAVDGDGGSTTDSFNLTVNNVAPAISSTTNTGAVEGGSSTISVTASDVPADPLSYEFDCDGNGTYGNAGDVGPQAGNSASCSFADDGAFTVNVRVTDGDGGSTTDSTSVTVTNADPTISSTTNTGAVEGGSSTISVTASDVPADPLSYEFDCDGSGTYGDAGDVGPQAGNSASCSFADDGAFTVNVRVTDGDGGSTTDSTSVTVTNADPVLTVTNATVTVNEGQTAANDGTFSDAGDDDVTVSATAVGSIAPPTSGNNGTWNWSYDTTDGPDQSQTITITGTDEDGGSGNVTFALVVNNVAPTGAGDSYGTDEDTPLAIAAPGVLNNDTDPGDDDLVATAQTAAPTAAGGTVTLATDGSFTYNPPADYFGIDSFDYEVCDSDGDCAPLPLTTVTIAVAPINDVPAFTIAADPPTVAEDSGAQAVALASGITPGAPALGNEADQSVSFSVTGNTNPALFAAGPAIAPDGELTYTSAANAFGSANVTVILSDDCGGGTPPASCGAAGVDTSGPQTFTITVTNVNDPPTFVSGGDVVTETGTGEQTVAWATGISVGPANENQVPTFIVTSFTCTPAGLLIGSPSVDPNGSVRYTPLDGQTGNCDISVKLSDGVDESAVVTFNLELVTATRPIADPQSVETDGGNPLTITLTGSDPDNQLPLAFQVIEPVTDADTGAVISDSGPFRGALDTTTPDTNPDQVSANVVYTPDGPTISQAAIIATESFTLEKFADILGGDVVVNPTGGIATVERSTSTPAGFAIKSDTLNVHPLAAIGGDALCNGGDYAAQCDNTLDLPVYDLLPPFLVGSVDDANDITVANKATVNLTPGLYGDIDVGREGNLVFAPGKYSMRSLVTDPKANLLFSGPTEIKIAERFVGGSNVHVNAGGIASEVIFYVAGDDSAGPAAVVGFNNADFNANVYAANGTVLIGQDSAVVGAFIGRHVVVENKATVDLDNGFGEAPDQFDFEVTDLQGLVSERATVLINEDDSCRDNAGQIVAIAAYGNQAATDGAASIDITLRGCESTDVPVDVSTTAPTQGTLSGLPTGAAGPPYEFVVTYTPADPVPNNRDSFDFTFDNGSSQATATVEINQPPCDLVEAVTTAGSFATDEGNTLTITLSGCDPDDGVLVFSIDDSGLSGCSTCGLGTLLTPATDNRPGHTSFNVDFDHSETAATTVTFDYTVTGLSGVDSKTITVEVNPVQQPPVANNDTFDVLIGGTLSGGNVLGNDTDVNNDPLTAALVGAGPDFASSFTLNPDGTFVYVHNGTANALDSFQYTANDGAPSNTATVTIVIGAIDLDVTLGKAGPAGSEDSQVFTIPDGIDCGAGCASQTASFLTTQAIKLVAVPANGFLFVDWTGDADCGDASLDPNGDRSCTANFVTDPGSTPQSVPVTIQKVGGAASGTVTSDPSGVDCGLGCTSQTFTVSNTEEKPRVQLIAKAQTGFVFSGFTTTDPLCEDQNPAPPALPVVDCGCEDGLLGGDLPADCTATFTAVSKVLTVTFVGFGSVSGNGIFCTGEPCVATYSDNTVVTISGSSDTSRNPNDVSWSGDCAGVAGFPHKTTITMNSNKNCTVNFN